MPVFTETSSSWRDLRILPSFAPPLPRLTLPLARNAAEEAERYEVVVIGVSQKLSMYRGSLTDATNT
jgi:phenol 2-monooxygenase